jgi:hypothetical protein
MKGMGSDERGTGEVQRRHVEKVGRRSVRR